MTGNLRRLSSVVAYIWKHPANEGVRARRLVRAAGWQIYKRVTGRAHDVPLYGGIKLRCYPGSPSASAALYSGGYPDWAEMTFMRHYLRPGDGFVDVGANIGVYTLLAASLVGPRGRVASFEPGPTTVARLRENVQLNGLGIVQVYPHAVADRAGTVRFDASTSTTARVVADGAAAPAAVEVPSVRLDDVLVGGSWAMGKMDIEGAEPLALRGAERLLGEMNPPVWLLEVNGLLRRYGSSEAELWAWLSERGWDLVVYDPARRLLCDCEEPSVGHGNVIAVARAARERVSARLREAA